MSSITFNRKAQATRERRALAAKWADIAAHANARTDWLFACSVAAAAVVVFCFAVAL